VKAEGAGAGAGPGEALLRLPLTATAVLAEKTVRLRDVLSLRPGEVMEFPRRVEEPLELRISGQPVAEGSAVKIGDRFGVRIGTMRPAGA
jgi:flagellar motor switch protein FliN/FliY